MQESEAWSVISVQIRKTELKNLPLKETFSSASLRSVLRVLFRLASYLLAKQAP
jgi:hypothetical protein